MAEVEEILHGDDADIGHGGFDSADHGPDDVLLSGAEVGLHGLLLELRRLLIPPAARGVVVVRAGVDDGVRDVLVRQVIMRVAVGESELENAHAGKIELLAQGFDIGGDDPKVLGDEGQVAELVAQALEELGAGSLDPLAMLGSLMTGGDGPEGVESTEVIQADDVVEGLGATQAVDPPGEALLLKDIPAIQGIPPTLTGSGEVVGGHAGDADGQEMLVELEDAGIGPHIGAVVVDEDGDVADELDLALGTVVAQ